MEIKNYKKIANKNETTYLYKYIRLFNLKLNMWKNKCLNSHTQQNKLFVTLLGYPQLEEK